MSETVVLRLDVIAPGDIDWAICSLPALRLERRDRVAFLECGADVVGTARTLLARAGARAVTIDTLPPRAASLLPARVSDLAPFDVADAIDIVTVRALDAGEAARVPGRRPFWRPTHDDVRLRDVLRGGDRMFAWWRIVWADRQTLRRRALGRVRPIVFDSDAVAHGQERRAYARDGALARWIGR